MKSKIIFFALIFTFFLQLIGCNSSKHIKDIDRIELFISNNSFYDSNILFVINQISNNYCLSLYKQQKALFIDDQKSILITCKNLSGYEYKKLTHIINKMDLDDLLLGQSINSTGTFSQSMQFTIHSQGSYFSTIIYNTNQLNRINKVKIDLLLSEIKKIVLF